MAVATAVAIAVIPVAQARPMTSTSALPNAAATAATIQAATITYSNDTTPSLSVRKTLQHVAGLDIILSA